MTIKKLTNTDYSAVLDLYTALDRIHWQSRPDYFGRREISFPKDAYMESLSEPECLMIGAFSGDHLMGIASATLRNKSGMIEGIKTVCLDNIYVLPADRRKGVAKALFQAVEDWSRQQNAIRLELHVWDFNQNAMELYRSLGMDFQYHVMEKKL